MIRSCANFLLVTLIQSYQIISRQRKTFLRGR
jgi:hypothetical protein